MHLLFTGCSWVAGDALAWDLLYPGETWSLGTPRYRQYSLDRKPYTLAHLTADQLSATYTDISLDGMSNLGLALEAIKWIDQYRGGYDRLVVCVGWTDPTRRRVWDRNQWIDLSVQYLEDPKLSHEFREYIRHAIVLRDPQDHYQDYLSAQLLLGSALLAKGIRSVQWRSVGEPFEPPEGLRAVAQAGWLSDPYGPSWNTLLSDGLRISKTNLHPNRDEVAAHATRIAKRIQCI
jgi:hypothetical protein